MAYYATEEGLQRAIKRNTRCTLCAQKKKADLGPKILAAHAAGFNNRDIARIAGCTFVAVEKHLLRAGLRSNQPRGAAPERVSDTHSRCRLCREVVPNENFVWDRRRADARQQATCRRCRSRMSRQAIGSSPITYFSYKQREIMRGGAERAKKRSSDDSFYSLPEGYLAGLWEWQRGLCFYTDVPMVVAVGKGRSPDSVSVDRVDVTKGYHPGNVVLCLTRINAIKHDVTLDEMRMWMPTWHARIAERLPVLVAEVLPVHDDRTKNAIGHRKPIWMDERKRLREAYLAQILGE